MEQKERTGLAIGVISRGYVPLRWALLLRQIGAYMPGGMFWDIITVEGKSWAEGRTEVVKKAKEKGFAKIMWLDDDVLPPPDIVRRLLSHNKKIITGIYWTKTNPSTPVIFKDFGDGPMVEFEPGEVFEIGGAGMGVVLTDMEVFDKFDEAGIPYFKENWMYQHPKFGNIRCPIGEDHYFFIHARELGYKVFCDSSILCDHYSLKDNKAYPPEEIIKKYHLKLAEKYGGSEEVKRQQKLLAEDPEKETIVFLNHVKAEFTGNEDVKRGIGGSEGDIIFLAREFHKQGYNVHVFCNCPQEGVFDGVRYHDIKKGIDYLSSLEIDYCIVSRNCNMIIKDSLKEKYSIKHLNLWLHDMPDSPANIDFDKAVEKCDSVVALSEFHKKSMCSAFPTVDPDKITIIPNGVAEKYFYPPKQEGFHSEREYGKFIYTSTPFRGLELLLKWWPEIKKEMPYASLDIYSSMKVYGESYAKDDEEFNHLYTLARKLEDVNYKGTVKKEVLGEAMRTATVLAYPNIFPETLCVTALEAQASGLPIVTSNLGALPEVIIPDTGILIGGDPRSEEYKEEFIRALKILCEQKDQWDLLSSEGPKENHSWNTRVPEWNRLFKNISSVPEVDTKKNIKKKIVFMNGARAEISKIRYLKDPMGASESSVVCLAEQFAKKGYDVSIFANCQEHESEGVHYYPITDNHKIPEIRPDICIVSRNTDMIAKNDLSDVCSSVYLWVHDLPESKSNTYFAEAYAKVEKVIVPSQFLKNALSERFDIKNPSKIEVIQNGVDTTYFDPEAEKEPYKLVYFSIPFKGLQLMPEIFEGIKKEIPEVTLDIYSDMNLYGHGEKDTEYKEIYEKLEQISGITLKGTVNKKKLAKEISKASVLCYPNSYRETFCCVAAEAQYAGLPVISSYLGALPETCDPKGAVLIEYTPANIEQYRCRFIDATVGMLRDPQLESIRKTIRNTPVDWRYKAEEWLRLLFPSAVSIDVNSKEYWDEIYRREIEQGKGRQDHGRFETIAQIIGAVYSDTTFLDVGCGTGELCDFIKRRYPDMEVWGSDISHVALDKARDRNRKCYFTNHPLEAPEFQEKYFDLITCCHTLEHLKNPSELLEKMKRLLKETGKLIIVLPYKDEPYIEHEKIYDTENSRELLETSGFDIRSVQIRKRGIFYKSGREFEEIILVCEKVKP